MSLSSGFQYVRTKNVRILQGITDVLGVHGKIKFVIFDTKFYVLPLKCQLLNSKANPSTDKTLINEHWRQLEVE